MVLAFSPHKKSYTPFGMQPLNIFVISTARAVASHACRISLIKYSINILFVKLIYPDLPPSNSFKNCCYQAVSK